MAICQYQDYGYHADNTACQYFFLLYSMYDDGFWMMNPMFEGII